MGIISNAIMIQYSLLRRFFYASLAFLSIGITFAENAKSLQLASVFSDHMVLQRNMNVPVWGAAKVGGTVTVKIAGKSARAKVSSTGSWKLTLPDLPAGGPYKMEVSSGSETITYSDILVGEVWICSGQSNMQMAYGSLKQGKQLWAEASKLPIRSLSVKRTVSFKPQEKMAGQWDAQPCASAVGLIFAVDLQKSLGVPVGIIEASWGSSSLEGWMPLSFTQQFPHFKKMMGNFEKYDVQQITKVLEKDKNGGERSRRDDIFLRTRPNVIYNAMMAPLAPYACRGIVWYQGESNSGSLGTMRQYGECLPAWVQHLRKTWGKEDLVFLAVMLPRFGKICSGSPNKELDAPDAYSWAWIREAQGKVLSLPHTGVANTIDLGSVKNIHPKDKEPIGLRLSLLAQQQVDDKSAKTIEAKGPTFVKMTPEGKNSLRLSMEFAKGLKTTDGKAPREFWVGDAKGEWKKAKAKIDGQSVVLSWSGVLTPKAVRYAFSAFPDVNLVNSSGLPAMPFRTDSFEPKGYNEEALEPGAVWRRKK